MFIGVIHAGAEVSGGLCRAGKFRHPSDGCLCRDVFIRKRSSALVALGGGAVVDRLALRTRLEIERRSARIAETGVRRVVMVAKATVKQGHGNKVGVGCAKLLTRQRANACTQLENAQRRGFRPLPKCSWRTPGSSLGLLWKARSRARG